MTNTNARAAEILAAAAADPTPYVLADGTRVAEPPAHTRYRLAPRGTAPATPGDRARALLSWDTGTDGEAYATLPDSAVVAVGLRPAPRSTLGAYGYGMTGTEYTVTTSDSRRPRRVYVLQYGNSGSLVVMVGGVMASIDIPTEHRLQDLRDATARAAAEAQRDAVRALAERAVDGEDDDADTVTLADHVADMVRNTGGVWDGSVGLTRTRRSDAPWSVVRMGSHREETAFDTLTDAAGAWCAAVDAENLAASA